MSADLTPPKRVAGLTGKSNRAYLAALRLTGDPELAEEAVQDAFVQLLRHPPADFGEEKYSAYFVKVTCGTARKLLRTRCRRWRREERYAASSGREVRSPEDTSMSEETARVVREGVGRLPAKQRIAVSLHLELGLSLERVSEYLEISRNTAASRVRLGVEKLRRHLVVRGVSVAGGAALVEMVRSLGIGEAPVSLTTRLGAIGSRFLETGALPQAVADGKTAASSALQIGSGVAVVLAAALGAALWVSGTREGDGQAGSPAAGAPGAADRLDHTWSFREGPVEGFRVLTGSWRWERDAEGVGHMVPRDEPGSVGAHVLLPARVPARPFLLTLKGTIDQRRVAGAGGSYWIVGKGYVEAALYERRRRRTLKAPPGPHFPFTYRI
jgi:RNA polymerase sigma-70 factor (ECF subfamily)